MAICKTCGKQYSRWTTPVSARGVCCDCFESELNKERDVEPQEAVSSFRIAPAKKPNERIDSDTGYVSFGYFDPFVARRIMHRFSGHGVRFEARDASRLDMASAGIGDYDTPVTRSPILAGNNRIELLVHSDYPVDAQRMVDEV